MSKHDEKEYPEVTLAKEIVEELIAKGLIRKKNSAEFIRKISTGGISQEDWRLEIELATEENNHEE